MAAVKGQQQRQHDKNRLVGSWMGRYIDTVMYAVYMYVAWLSNVLGIATHLFRKDGCDPTACHDVRNI